MMNALKRFWNDEEGAAMVEYAILIAIITAGTIWFITQIGGKVTQAFTDVNSAWN